MTNGLLARLSAGGILVADGAMGSLLMERGLGSGECPEALNLSRPQLLREIAELYLAAGADIIQTNTFGASPLKLAQYGLAGRTEEVNRAAVKAVRDAIGQRALVSGSVGPSGKILEPYGDAEPTEVLDGFRLQVRALLDGGVDLLCIETMTDLAEAKLAVEAVRDADPEIPVLATMTFDATPRGFFTVMGVDVASAAKGLLEAGADVVGSNCGNGSEKMVAIAREFRRHTEAPLVIQPNAGLPELVGERVVYGETPEFIAERAGEMLEAGVAIIGGCCGTTPEHTAALRRLVDGVMRSTHRES